MLESQDRSSMIWIREVVQNARDALLKARKTSSIHRTQNAERIRVGNADIEFFQNNAAQFVARITDPVGMSPHEVRNYLLPPGETSKVAKDGGGMFGQGFYSLLIGAQDLTLKTSIGDGTVTYVRFIPNVKGPVDDFELSIVTRQEPGSWQGTVIERTDEAQGIMTSIQALLGIQYTDLYIGNVDPNEVRIAYNGIERNTGTILFGESRVDDLGVLSLRQNPDRKERLTSRNLYVSEIHDAYLEMLPAWMVRMVHSHGLSIDLPQGIELTASRNAIADAANIQLLQPHIFRLVCDYIVDGFYRGRNTIEMLPLDYLGLSSFDTRHTERVSRLAKQYNRTKLLSPEDMSYLKKPKLMVEFLVLIENIEVA